MSGRRGLTNKAKGLAQSAVWALTLSLAVPGAPALAAELGADGPIFCQALVDGYAARQAGDPELPDLFDGPYSFETMDWADDAGAKAVNVLKQQYFAEMPGIVGALFCLPDGLVKQVTICAETAETDGATPAIDRLRKMSAALFSVIGATEAAHQALPRNLDALAGSSSGEVPPGGFIKLDGPVYAFITGEDGAVCMAVSQTTKQ